MSETDRKEQTRRLGLISLGCPKNTVDSERILGELYALGWRLAEIDDEPDCIIVNTCGFIRDAILESEEAIEEVCALKSELPEVKLVVTGCLPQREGIRLRDEFPEIDLVVGVGSLHELPVLLENLISGERTNAVSEQALCVPGRAALSLSNDPRLRLTPSWAAYMKIAEGCSHSCAFCTIPSIKGPYRSRTIEDLVIEARILAEEDVREIILISQDTTAYGSDIGTNLRKLLKELDRVDGIEWIRLHYLYPGKISGGLLDVIAESRHVLPYFDIPVQHVNPRILKAMERPGADINVMKIIEGIRDRFTDSDRPACIRSTIIAGFPGETDDDFAELLDFVETVRIDRLSVFRFSAEEGTKAAEMDEQVPEEVARERVELLMETQQDVSLEINEGWIRKEMDVLMEGVADDGGRIGRSYRDAPEIDGLVYVRNLPDDIDDGSIVRAGITGALPYDLEAEWLG
jgi:ribosomal protein S12 methylthiotransferase